MTHEILEHSCRILRHESTRTLPARGLHRRVCAELGAGIPLERFLEILAAAPDRVTIAGDRTALDEGWTDLDRQLYAPALELAGLVRGATVVLIEPPAADEPIAPEPCADFAAVAATLADAHAAVVELIRMEHDGAGIGGLVADAVAELDELRQASSTASRLS